MPEQNSKTPSASLGVILTNYNHGTLIRRALTALTHQERHPDQLIIVDDGSEDNSLEVIKPFLADSRVTLVRKEKNEGLASAVLSGLELVNTDLLYFAAADDYVYPGFFSRVTEAAIAHPEAAMIYGRLVNVTWPPSNEIRLGLTESGAPDGSGLLSPKDFFTRYFCKLGSMANLSPATVYRVWALKQIQYETLLRDKFEFILDSFVVQIIGGQFPSYFVDADCAAWTSGDGGSRRFYEDQNRVLNFVLAATRHLQRAPYVSSLAPDHFGLYLYGIWSRAIETGFHFSPMDKGETDALRDAHRVLTKALRNVSPVAPFAKRIVWQFLLGLPKISLGLSFHLSKAIVRILQMGNSTRLPRMFRRTSGGQASVKVATQDVISNEVRPPPVAKLRERKTLSALICNYNHAHFITHALDSIVGQTRHPDELLIMDDGSTDGSFEIIKHYADQHPWIKAYRKEINQGYISGISELTKIAKGDFIHRGTSDDFMEPHFIETTLEMAEQYPTVGIVSTALTIVQEQSNITTTLEVPWWRTGYKHPDEFLHHYLEVAHPRGTLAPSTIYRKSVVEEVGGWREDLDTWDVSFVLQAAALKYGMAYIDVPAYSWVARPGGWTQKSTGDVTKAIQVCHRYFSLMRAPEFRHLFGEIFPERWLATNLRHISDSKFTQIVEYANDDNKTRN